MYSFLINSKLFNTNEMVEDNSVINVIGKYTFENANEIKESIPVMKTTSWS